MRAGRRPGRRRGVVGRQRHPKNAALHRTATCKRLKFGLGTTQVPRHRVFGTPRTAPQRVSARRSTLNAVYRLTGLPVARGAARGSPCPQTSSTPRDRRTSRAATASDEVEANGLYLMLLPPSPARRRSSGSAASTGCGPVRGDQASRGLTGHASRAWATAGRAVGSLA